MFTTCEKCGLVMSNSDKTQNGFGLLECVCGFSSSYKKLPLFVLTGASGVGKSTIGRRIQAKSNDIVVLESDILWNDYYNNPESNYAHYRKLWLNLCKNINQAGKPTLLVGCGTPDQFQNCEEKDYFSKIVYIVIATSTKNLECQLMSRPEYRNCSSQSYIDEHTKYNNWNKNNWNKTNPPMHLVNIEHFNITESVKAVEDVIKHEMSKE